MVLFLRKRDSLYTAPYTAAVPKKKKQTTKQTTHHLPWEVHNKKENTKVSQNRSKVKQTEVYRNMLTVTEEFIMQNIFKIVQEALAEIKASCPQLKAQVKH